MARAGEIPAHPLGQGKRKQWRFRLSELADAFVAESPVPECRRKVLSKAAVPGNRIGSEDLIVPMRWEGALQIQRLEGSRPGGLWDLYLDEPVLIVCEFAVAVRVLGFQ